MKCTILLPRAHSEKQAQIIRCLADPNGPRFIWVACGTKFGKTFAASAAMANVSPRRKQGWYRWIAPTHKAARIGMRYMKRLLPGEPFSKVNRAEGTITYPSHDTVIEFLHGKDPESTIEGEAVHGYVMDEASKLDKQVYDSAMTTVTQTGGKMLIISTPRGRNWFYKGCMRAQEIQEAARIKGVVPKEIFITARTMDNRHVSREFIEDSRRLMQDRLFRQYYMAEFLDDGAVFVGFDKCVRDMEEYQKEGPIECWMVPDHKDRVIVAGGDWAKKQDDTVITAWDYTKRPFECVGFLKFNQTPYTEAVTEAVRFLRKFKRCDLFLHDKTGLGEVIDDMLACIPGLSYRGITFTSQTKAMMANRLITSVERHGILVPNWPAMNHQFTVFEVQVNALGGMRYTHPDGDHDDVVWSSALGHVACEELAGTDFEVKIVEDYVPHVDPNSLEGFIRSQISGLDIDPDEGF